MLHEPGRLTLLAAALGMVVGAYALAPIEPTKRACPSDTPDPSIVDEDDRIEIPTAGLPHKGASPDRTRVTAIECADYACPFSARASRTFDGLLARNPDLALFHVHAPLPLGEERELMARAAIAAQQQGEFWAMHDALYRTPVASEEDATKLAATLGLDRERFARDLGSAATHTELRRQTALCDQASVNAVPTFFINGKRVVGARPAAEFQRVIDHERLRR